METIGPSDGPQFEVPTAHPDVVNTPNKVAAAILTASAAEAGAPEAVAQQIGASLANADKPDEYDD